MRVDDSGVGLPLLRLEREAYVKALRNAIGGVEGARIVLTKTPQRMGGA
jgi:hypothetical protein